jgi:hypothetical protein
MSPLEAHTRADARRLGRERLAARRRRTTRIRATVASTAVAVFVAFFSTIYVQLANGHDPALAASTKNAAATTTVQSSTSTGSSSSNASTSAPAQPSPVTTQQS